MNSQQLRFHMIEDDEQRWTVFDTEAGMVACFGAENLQGLTEFQARTFATILNEIHPPRTQVAAGHASEVPVRLN